MSDEKNPQYWVRSRSGAKGPISRARLKELRNSGKLPDDSLIAKSPDGPWKRMNSQESKNVSTNPVVDEFRLKKGILGQYTAWYFCPNCKSELHSSEDEMQADDQCPECYHLFRLTPNAIAEIQSLRERVLAEREQKKEETQRRKEEKRYRKEDERRQKDEERRLELMRQATAESEAERKQATGTFDEDPVDRHTPLIESDGNVPPLRLQAHCWYCGQTHNFQGQCPFCRMLTQ